MIIIVSYQQTDYHLRLEDMTFTCSPSFDRNQSIANITISFTKPKQNNNDYIVINNDYTDIAQLTSTYNAIK